MREEIDATARGRTVGITNLAQYPRVQSRLLEKLDGHLSRDDANAVRVGLPEELAVHALLFLGEVEVRAGCGTLVNVSSSGSARTAPWARAHSPASAADSVVMFAAWSPTALLPADEVRSVALDGWDERQLAAGASGRCDS